MRAVILEGEVRPALRFEGVHERADRSVTFAGEGEDLAGVTDLGLTAHGLLVDGRGAERDELERGGDVDEVLAEAVVDLGGREFLAELVGVLADEVADFRMHELREVEAELAVEHVGDAAFAALGVDADDGLVGTTDVHRVDGEVGDVPERVVADLTAAIHAFLDGVLVRARKGREDEVAAVRMAVMHAHAGHALVDLADRAEVAEVEVRVDAVREHVQRDGDDVEVARALAVAEERAFHAVRSSHQAELGGGDAGAAVVVRVQGDDGHLAVTEMAAEPLDLVGMRVRRAGFDGERQVEDDLALGASAPGLRDRFADLEGVVGLGEHECLRAELQLPLRIGQGVGELADELRAGDGHLEDLRLREVEDDLTLGRVGRRVEVDDRATGALEGIDRAADEVFAGLDEDLHRDVLGDELLFDELAGEGELRVRGGREANLDFLEADATEGLEELVLLRHVHRDRQGLVAVAEVDRAPAGGLLDACVRPAAVGEADGLEGAVFLPGGFHGGRSSDGGKGGKGWRAWVWAPKSKKPTRKSGWVFSQRSETRT